MDLEKLNDLKQKGNDAFIADQLDEAVNFYSEAIDMAKELEYPMSKILLSNRSQTYLKQQKYELAIEDAEASLKLDPSFLKSILRRAVANAELNNRQGAIDDFRKILKAEPRNATVLSFMRRLSLRSKIHSSLYDAYIAQFLRRKVPGFNCLVSDGNYVREQFKCFLFRQAFLSVNGANFMQRFISGVGIIPIDGDSACFILPRWFQIRRLKQLTFDDAGACIKLSKKSLEIFLKLTKPLNATFSIDSKEDVKNFGELYEYSNVRVAGDWKPSFSPKCKDVVDFIRQNSQIITHLPYRLDVLKFNDTTFPNINTLLVPLDLSVNMEFLKAWKKKKWGIKTICFLDDVPNLRSFKDFTGAISSKVNHVYFALEGDKESLLFHPAGLGPLYKELNSLKRVFPALSEVTGTVICHFSAQRFKVDVIGGLKERICFFAEKFKTNLKPDWCSLKISVDYVFMMEFGDMLCVDWVYMDRVIEECRRELKDDLHYIRFHLPSSRTFSLITSCYYAMIEFKTDQAEFQIALVMHRVKK